MSMKRFLVGKSFGHFRQKMEVCIRDGECRPSRNPHKQLTSSHLLPCGPSSDFCTRSQSSFIMNHGFADDANSGVRPELCGDRFHASTMCAIDLGSRVDSGFNTKQSSKDMQSETNNGMHSKKSVAHSKSSVSHSKISRTTPAPNKIMHPAPRGADALALLMVDVEPSSDESLSDISGCGSKTSYPAEGEDVEMYTYTQPWGDAGPRPGETDGLTNREDFQRADSHKSLDAEARPGHGLSNSIPLDQAEEGMIKFANDPLKPPVLVTITTSYYSDSASNGLATLLDQEGIEDLLDDLSSMNFDYSSNYSNNETSPLADDGCNHEASKVIYATVGHSSSCGTVLVSIASNRHCSVECTDRATGCIASSTCSCVVDELAAEAHDRTLQVPSPGNLTRIGSTSGHLSVASSKLESVDQSVPSAGSFACDELSVGSPQEALKRDEDESSPSTCAQQLVEQASQGPSIAENSRLAGGSDEQQGVGTVPLSAEEYARKLKTELTMEELMSIMADEESDGFDDNADDLDGPEMILYAAALSQSLNENSVIPDKAERQETPGIFLKSNMECSSSQHSTKDDPLGKEPLSIAPGDASDDGNYQKKKPPARKKSEILEIEDEKYSPNRPHPALEYPLLYFILRRFPPFFERVKVLYAYRWRFTYPLQRNVPFSRSLRKAGIHSTWGELLIIMPFFASVIACLLYTAVFPSVSVTGKIARFAVIASLVFAQRNSLVTLLLGMPFDRGIFYHKLAGQVAGVTGLLHTVAFFFDPKLRRIHEADPFGGAFTGQVNISGSVFMLLIVATIVTSLPQVRRRVFEVFYYLHVVFAVGMIACAFNHTGKLVPILALLTWGVDLFIRSIVMARTRYPRKATLKLISETVIEVSFPKTSAFAYNPGQYVFLAIPELSWLQWHPFSISSSPKQRVVTLHIRKAGNWTAALFDLCKKKTEVSILLEGPYGNLSVDIVGDRRYKSIMLISGGIGSTLRRGRTFADIDVPFVSKQLSSSVLHSNTFSINLRPATLRKGEE